MRVVKGTGPRADIPLLPKVQICSDIDPSFVQVDYRVSNFKSGLSRVLFLSRLTLALPWVKSQTSHLLHEHRDEHLSP